MTNEKPITLGVEGRVRRQDGEPDILLFLGADPLTSMSVAEARSFAADILTACGRIEADAGLIRYFGKLKLPEEAVMELMIDLRIMRGRIDAVPVEQTRSTPSGDTSEYICKCGIRVEPHRCGTGTEF